jgi:hypothetical protein
VLIQHSPSGLQLMYSIPLLALGAVCISGEALQHCLATPQAVDPPTKGVPLRQLLRLQLDAAASGIAVHFCGNSQVQIATHFTHIAYHCHRKHVPTVEHSMSRPTLEWQCSLFIDEPSSCLGLQPLASTDGLTATGIVGIARQVTAPPAIEPRAFDVGRHRFVTTQVTTCLPAAVEPSLSQYKASALPGQSRLEKAAEVTL